MKYPKQRLDVYIDYPNYMEIMKEASRMGYKNLSQATNEAITEWRRFKAIVLKHQAQKEVEDLKNAEVIK
jgi:hypothetical protein